MGSLLALVTFSTSAKELQMNWKTEKNDLFSCELPEKWRGKTISSGEQGYFYTGGLLSIRAARLPGAIKDYLAHRAAATPGLQASSVKVEGHLRQRLQWQYQTHPGPDERARASEWIYEETVLVPQNFGFWELMLRSSSFVPQKEPSGNEIWQHFLKSFHPTRKGDPTVNQ